MSTKNKPFYLVFQRKSDKIMSEGKVHGKCCTRKKENKCLMFQEHESFVDGVDPAVVVFVGFSGDEQAAG